MLHHGRIARASSLAGSSVQDELRRTRNIGIIAHIDAGKTTTTERMLYYSGHTRRIGDVDEGSTVTDFLPAERARGITIQSAAISFQWPPGSAGSVSSEPEGARKSSIPHNINLIDTPGHADFTFEVLRSLRVLDGAVCILDGVAGVEAQTEKVWTQANHYRIPRIAYVNKLDRDGATFNRTVKEIGTRLRGWPAVCQIPWWRAGDRKLCGIGDVIGLRALLWQEGGDGTVIESFSLEQLESKDASLAKELIKARAALVEILSEFDDNMVESFLEHDENHSAIPETDIVASLRRCVLQSPQTVIPVLAGASFRNIGVQPLLDAVVDLLPSPLEAHAPDVSVKGIDGTLPELLSGKLLETAIAAPRKKHKAKGPLPAAATIQNLQGCGLAFKVVNDSKRGILVYVRVYSGSIARGSPVFNTNLSVTERAPRLLRMYGSEAVEIPSIEAGQIGVIVGLKHARTGDTLISYANMSAKAGPPEPLNALQLRPIAVPPPLFFTSVIPNTLSEEKHVEESLEVLLREDPSLNVSKDLESGQTHLAGMGELHLEIARDRLLQDFKARAEIGKIEINYREAIPRSGQPRTVELDREIAGKQARATAVAAVAPRDENITSSDEETAQHIELPDNNVLTVRHPTLDSSGQPFGKEDKPLPPQLSLSILISAIASGTTAALARGPSYSLPLHSTHVIVTLDTNTQLFPDTSSMAVSMATRQAVTATLKASTSETSSAVMEPVMLATISVNESGLGSVVQDLSSARGGQVLSLDGEESTHQEDNSLTIDAQKIYAPPDPWASDTGSSGPGAGVDKTRQITARVPLREMVGYLKHLRSLTGGRGTFIMQVDRFEKVGGQRLKRLLSELRGI
ncbi:mitochondrial translation elongation factor-like protein G [Trichodelitschia bisporula]|uniref:Ribosome-releasing factor 2, mitochondrial n=1 Tax=Trichodelitschia bisporula TaxID=703511 RepID=A0A6G1HYN9_9PEZI|nr:mitochondrial translation elongation factor-like protein G [Trichodelitschia bisporula]